MNKEITIKINQNEFETILATIICRYNLLNEHGRKGCENFVFKCKNILRAPTKPQTKEEVKEFLRRGAKAAESFEAIIQLGKMFKD